MRAYAETTSGQVPYRMAGSGDALVAMHWAPASGRQHSALLPKLAERGFRASAPDLMGYGDSDKPTGQWSIADHAKNLGEWLDALELETVYLYGGHTTAAVATEFAVQHPSRVRALILDGSPVLDAEKRAAFVGTFAPPLLPTTDGVHLTWAWQRALRYSNSSLEEASFVCLDILKAGRTYHTGYEAVWGYEMATRLPLLRTRVLAMTTPDDPLVDAHRSVMTLIDGCREYVGPVCASQSEDERAESKATLFDAFFRRKPPFGD